MSKSSTLHVPDLRAVVQLVGECRELGDDPVLWRQHLIAGLGRLTGGGFCVAAEIGDGTQPSRYDLGTVDLGADNGFNRTYWLRSFRVCDGRLLQPAYERLYGICGWRGSAEEAERFAADPELDFPPPPEAP